MIQDDCAYWFRDTESLVDQKHLIVLEIDEGQQNGCLHQKEGPFLINSSPVMPTISLQPHAVLLVLRETDLRTH